MHAMSFFKCALPYLNDPLLYMLFFQLPNTQRQMKWKAFFLTKKALELLFYNFLVFEK